MIDVQHTQDWEKDFKLRMQIKHEKAKVPEYYKWLRWYLNRGDL